jgi:hypothetical protein
MLHEKTSILVVLVGSLKSCLILLKSKLSLLRIQFFRHTLFLTELEWILGQTGAVPTELEGDPRPKVRDVLFSKLESNGDDLGDDNDW